jgi:hypothetical protein
MLCKRRGVVARVAIGRSQRKTLAVLKDLADARVLHRISEGTDDRQFAANGLFALVTAYEASVVDQGHAV